MAALIRAFSSGARGGREALDSIDGVCNSFRLEKAYEGVTATSNLSADVLDQCKEL